MKHYSKYSNGTKVVCISLHDPESDTYMMRIHIGGEYLIINNKMDSKNYLYKNYYSIRNDDGEILDYHMTLFYTLADYRKEKLQRIFLIEE